MPKTIPPRDYLLDRTFYERHTVPAFEALKALPRGMDEAFIEMSGELQKNLVTVLDGALICMAIARSPACDDIDPDVYSQAFDDADDLAMNFSHVLGHTDRSPHQFLADCAWELGMAQPSVFRLTQLARKEKKQHPQPA